MRILIMDNDFAGAYGSFGTFLSEIKSALLTMGHEVEVSHSVGDSVGALARGRIDFSIGIGKYEQRLGDFSLYDASGIRHYQWVVDCPYKIDLDTESDRITYLFIDRDFGLVDWGVRNRPIYLPLGVPPPSDRTHPKRVALPGVVFAGQVRDPSSIRMANLAKDGGRKVSQAIDFCLANLSRPFLANFGEFTAGMDGVEKRALFRPVNSFVRAYKRELVISQIKSCPVMVVGEVTSRAVLAQRNVRCIGRLPYVEAFEQMGASGYALNVEPNFNSGRHDRVIRAPFHSALPVTNAQVNAVDGLAGTLIEYSYNAVEDIEVAIGEISGDEWMWRLERLRDEIVRSYAWSVLLQRVVDDFAEVQG